jgi:rhamnogalacturonyl hydrolase YesR
MKKLEEEQRKNDITPKDIVNEDVAEELTEIYHKLLNHTREMLSAYPKSKMKYHLKEYISSMVTNRTIPYVDRFFWPNGLLAVALEHSFQVSKNHQDFYCMVDYYNRWFASGMKLRHLDYGINGYSLILIHQLTKDDKYKKMIDRMVHYLYNHPKDEYGSLPYRIARNKDIYIDSIGMICPFLCRYGSVYHDPNATQLAIKQITNFLKFGFDSKTGLPYHGYNRKERLKYGIIGWGRALGWLLIGLADSLPYIASNHPKYEYLCESFIRIVETTIKFQKSSGYYSWQLTAMEGHIDTSATAMISYAIKRGVSIGILDKLYLYHAMLGLGALERSIVNGEVTNASQECMGFGMYPQNYGKYPWAQGPTTALIALSLEEILKKDEDEKS